MKGALSDIEVRNFFTELTYTVYKIHLATKSISLPGNVDLSIQEAGIPNSNQWAAPIAGYIHFVSKTLGRKYQPLYERAFPSFIKSQSDFWTYSMMCCERLCDAYYHHVGNASALYPLYHRILFLFECVFIYEFAVFCFRKQCYRYSLTANNCILALYYGHFRRHFNHKTDLVDFGIICEHKLRNVRHSDVGDADEFIQSLMCHDISLYDVIFGCLLGECLSINLETILDIPCSIEVRKYLIPDYCDAMAREEACSELPNVLCSFCGYACLIHLLKLLRFDISEPSCSSL